MKCVNKIILDPVMIAKGGYKLISDQAIDMMKKKLFKKNNKTTKVNQINNVQLSLN